MINEELRKWLDQREACSGALEWLGTRGLATAWGECDRGDWLLWLAGMAGVDRRRLVLAACACARGALPYIPEGENRPRVAIETAEKWARGEEGVTLGDVRRAACAAYAACATDATDAAYAATDAAYAAYAAADAAAYAAAYAAAWGKSLARSAEIVRQHITLTEIEAAMRNSRSVKEIT